MNNILRTSGLVDDCFAQDPRDAARLTHARALAELSGRIRPITAIESVPIAQAAGRIAGEQISAHHPIPGHTNAAVDGYAVAHAAYVSAGDAGQRVAGRAAAGQPFDEPAPADGAVRIFTGAVVPAGLDTVAMQEDCTTADGRVWIPAGLKPGANVRRAGEDVSPGDVLTRPGQVLRPQDIAALASSGHARIGCHAPVRVGIASTGDEVVAAREGARLGTGQVFDVNGPMLTALVAAAGGVVIDLGIWPDRREIVEEKLVDAASRCDLILTSGGASKGEEDHIAHAIAAHGNRHFWQIAVKPGRPLMFGQVGGTVIAGLPGNPVAVFVCFLLYVTPMLRRLGGGDWFEPRRFPLPATFHVPKRKLGRREFWRGTTVQGESGLAVEKFARDGSGLISGLRAADGLIDIPEDRPSVAPGELVDFIPFSEFGIV